MIKFSLKMARMCCCSATRWICWNVAGQKQPQKNTQAAASLWTMNVLINTHTHQRSQWMQSSSPTDIHVTAVIITKLRGKENCGSAHTRHPEHQLQTYSLYSEDMILTLQYW